MALNRKRLPEQIADLLRGAIIKGEYRPGQRLLEAELSQRLGVSRGPLREAFMLLLADGLLVGEPWQGVSVVELEERDLWEIFSLRKVLEGLAVEMIAENHDEATLRELRSIVERMNEPEARRDYVQLMFLDLEFHATVCRRSGHTRLADAWNRLKQQLVPFFLSAEPLFDAQEIFERHNELIDEIASGHVPRAVSCIRSQIDDGWKRLQSSRVGGEPMPG